MINRLSLALAAGIAAFGSIGFTPTAEAQRAQTRPGAVNPTNAIERAIRGRSIVSYTGNRVNLFADGRASIWDNYAPRVSGRGVWRMCGEAVVCIQGPRASMTVRLTLNPDGRSGIIHGNNGGSFTLQSIDPRHR